MSKPSNQRASMASRLIFAHRMSAAATLKEGGHVAIPVKIALVPMHGSNIIIKRELDMRRVVRASIAVASVRCLYAISRLQVASEACRATGT